MKIGVRKVTGAAVIESRQTAPFWSVTTEQILSLLRASAEGLRWAVYKSTPSSLLLSSGIFMAALAIGLPYMGSRARLFAFDPPDMRMMIVSLAIVALYAAVADAAKRRFFLRRER